ncbi:MAG TPA: DUF4142 domain-containing protein [Alphaproteobacteria bacterium]|jgi:putative membrane protein
MTARPFSLRFIPIVFAVTFAVFALPATAQTMSAPPAGKATQDYLQHAGMGDLFEVQSSKLALDRTKSNDVKSFASMMIKDHTDSTKKLLDAAKSQKIDAAAPAKLDDAHQATYDRLQKDDAAAFDADYMKAQVSGHEDALTLHRAYAKDGENAAIKKVSADIVKTVEHHLDEAKKLSAKVSK